MKSVFLLFVYYLRFLEFTSGMGHSPVVSVSSDPFIEEVFEDNTYRYENSALANSGGDWDDAHTKCVQDSGFPDGDLAQFLDDNEYNNVKDDLKIGDVDFWIGLVSASNGLYWNNGMEYQIGDISNGLWSGGSPDSNTYLDAPQCVRTTASGSSTKLKLTSCSDTAYALCQDIPIITTTVPATTTEITTTVPTTTEVTTTDPATTTEITTTVPATTTEVTTTVPATTTEVTTTTIPATTTEVTTTVPATTTEVTTTVPATTTEVTTTSPPRPVTFLRSSRNSSTYALIVKALSTNQSVCVRLNFGDDNLILVTSTNQDMISCANIYNLSPFQYQHLEMSGLEASYEHTYRFDGSYQMTCTYFHENVYVTLYYSELSITTNLEKKCSVDIQQETGDLMTLKSENIILSSYLEIDCDNTSYTTEFKWTAHNCIGLAHFHEFNQSNGVSANIEANVLNDGCNIMLVTVNVFDGSIYYTKESSRYVYAERATLVAEIIGGNTRTVDRNSPVIIDAESKSYDPNLSPSQTSSLTFLFHFQLSPLDIVRVLGSNGDTSYGPVSLQGVRLGVLKINLPSTEVSDDITVTITVSDDIGDSASFTQHITLNDVPPPFIEIKCIQNCANGLTNPTLDSVYEIDFLSLEAYLDRYFYHWKLFKYNTLNQSEGQIINITSLDTRSRLLKIPANFITTFDTFLIRCEVENERTSGVALVTSNFQTKSVPYGGSCSVSPNSGVAIETKFEFSCSNWMGDFSDGDIIYNYKTVNEDEKTLLTTSSSTTTLPTIVPSGPAERNFKVTVEVAICVNILFCAFQEITLEVTPYNISQFDPSEITNTAQSLDVAYLTQLASEVLRNGTENETEIRSELSTLFIASSTDILTAEGFNPTSDNVRQLSGVANAAVNIINDFSDNVTVSSSVLVNKLGLNLKLLSESSSSMLAAEETTTIAKSLTQTIGLLYEKSSSNSTLEKESLLDPKFEQFKPEPNELLDLSPREVLFYKNLEAEKQKVEKNSRAEQKCKAIQNLLGGSEGVAGAMDNVKLAVSNQVASIGTSNFDVSVMVSEPSNVNSSLNLNSSTGNDVKFSGGTNDMTAKVESLATNALNFDDSAVFVTSGVVRMSFDNNQNNGNSDVTVKLRNNEENLEDILVTMEANRISTSRFELRSSSNAILIYLIPSEKVLVNVWIRHQIEPIIQAYSSNPDVKADISDFVFHLPDSSQSGSDQYKLFIPSKRTKGVGVYYLSVEIVLADTRRRRSVNNATVSNVNITMNIFTPSCKTYNELLGVWEDGGCSASPDSTKENTNCVCAELQPSNTISAEFFVAPNFIDFSTVFSKVDLLNNGSVLWTVVSFLIVFFLLIIWARRQDKKDTEKWAVKLLADNPTGGGYYYKLSVVTGMGRASGTTSNIFFVLAGEDGKTHTRKLKDASGKLWFESGSIVQFLLCVPRHLGSLQYIHVWHDNTGVGRTGASWYLDDVIVEDLHDDEIFFFPCDTWLAVELGDGKIDRVLAVAGEETLTSYKRVFSLTAKEGLNDGNLLFSAFINHNQSNFTRCQRLACAWLALFLTMISNAMFYFEDSEVEETSGSSIMIGPILIDFKTIWISVVSSLLVLPASLLVVQLFRKTGNKKNKDAVVDLSFESLNEPQKSKNSNLKTLPHCFVYVGWIIFAIGVIASGFFTILYSFQWGKEKSERWLSSTIFSIAENAIIIEPIKIVLIAVVLAFLCRKTKNLAKKWEESQDIIMTPPPPKDFNDEGAEQNQVEDTNIHTPEPDSHLVKIRRQRKVEKRAVQFSYKLVIFLAYIVLLFYVAYHDDQNSNFYPLTRQMKNALQVEEFEEISSVADLWEYIENTLIANLYCDTDYNGVRKKWRERVFIDDGANYRVGPVRLRLVRTKPETCSNNILTELIHRLCYFDYFFYNEDTTRYSSNWRNFHEADFILWEDYWSYANSDESKSLPMLGKLAYYGGGGYLADLGVNKETALSTVRNLYQNLWISRPARAMFVEFTLYNANTNIFSTVVMTSEFPSTGGVVTTATIQPFFLYTLSTSVSVFAATCLAGCIAVYYIAMSIKKFVKGPRKFFRDIWNLFAVMRITLVFSLVITSLLGYSIQEETIESFQENTYIFTNFHTLSALSSLQRDLIGSILFFESIRTLEFFRHQKQIVKFAIMFHNGATVIIEFLIYSLLTIIAYSLVAYIVFSVYLKNFQTFTTTVETLFGILLGSPEYQDMSSVSIIFAKIIFFAFNCHLTFLMLNLLFGTIDILLHSSRAEVKKSKDEKHAYLEITFGLCLNSVRRFFNKPEIPCKYFLEDDQSEDIDLEPNIEDCELGTAVNCKSGEASQTRRKPVKKRRRRRLRRAKISNRVQDSVSDEQYMALKRLRDIEQSIDLIDFVDEFEVSENKEKKTKPKTVAEEVDLIFGEISPDLLHL